MKRGQKGYFVFLAENRPMHDPSKGALPLAAGSAARTVEEALLSRRSIRAFRPDPVPRESVERILAIASRAPSGTNVQPWKVYAVGGEMRERIASELHATFLAHGEEGWRRQYEYYPTRWRDPYLARRRKLGWDLYGLLGIGKGEREKTKQQHARNFLFFDAPAALIFTIEDDFEKGSWLDYGMFIQSVMLAARGMGLDTCPQAAIGSAHEVLRRHLPIGEHEVVICGMSLGYADPDAVENKLVTEREPVGGFAKFWGFGK
jgi:nitroreductase